MCDLLFGNSFSTLNYKYYQVTSGAKTFSHSHFSSRYRSKESPPNSVSNWGGSTKFAFGRGLSQNANEVTGRFSEQFFLSKKVRFHFRLVFLPRSRFLAHFESAPYDDDKVHGTSYCQIFSNMRI